MGAAIFFALIEPALRGNISGEGPRGARETHVQPDAVVQERGADRRRSRRPVIRERRSGFERRRSVHRGPVGAAYESSLVYLRDHPATLIRLLVLANLLSVLDLTLTLILFRLGVAEGNPIMEYFFDGSVVQATIVKCGLIAVISLAIWSLRRFRPALVTALFLVGLYAAVVLYEVAGLLHLSS